MPMMRTSLFAVFFLFMGCHYQSESSYDVIIRGGTIYNGSGQDPFIADVAIQGDTIAAIGDLSRAMAAVEINAAGLAVAPGFINMLSWAPYSLLEDGKSQSVERVYLVYRRIF